MSRICVARLGDGRVDQQAIDLRQRSPSARAHWMAPPRRKQLPFWSVANAEDRRRYRVLKQETSLRDQLARCASAEDAEIILRASSPTARVLQMQSADLQSLLDVCALSAQSHLDILKVLRDLHDHQSRYERVKNFPYRRQYAVVSALFVGIFCILMPLGMIGQLERLDAEGSGFMKGHVEAIVPFSVVIGWMHTSLDQIGDGTFNPFEGEANDVPISQISDTIEIELRELLGEKDLLGAIGADQRYRDASSRDGENPRCLYAARSFDRTLAPPHHHPKRLNNDRSDGKIKRSSQLIVFALGFLEPSGVTIVSSPSSRRSAI